ncbi:MAG: sigma-70 family RNA polymerase sigma factor [Clostridia bacterium]|nr:sigma-70 family RNA polymerase sigma factor [Clostridia bacterium]
MKVKGVRTINKKKYINAQLQECYDKYRLKLFNYCLSRLNGSREAADDCVQETFIVFYNKLLDGNEFEDPKTFLYRTANNFVKRQKQKDARELKRQVPLENAENISVTDEEYDERIDLIDYEIFAKMLIDILSDEEKELYNLRYVQKISVEKISEKTGISRPAASMRLMRLRNKIKDMVYSINFEGGERNDYS